MNSIIIRSCFIADLLLLQNFLRQKNLIKSYSFLAYENVIIQSFSYLILI
jgi:hypothetical protein